MALSAIPNISYCFSQNLIAILKPFIWIIGGSYGSLVTSYLVIQPVVFISPIGYWLSEVRTHKRDLSQWDCGNGGSQNDGRDNLLSPPLKINKMTLISLLKSTREIEGGAMGVEYIKHQFSLNLQSSRMLKENKVISPSSLASLSVFLGSQVTTSTPRSSKDCKLTIFISQFFIHCII